MKQKYQIIFKGSSKDVDSVLFRPNYFPVSLKIFDSVVLDFGWFQKFVKTYFENSGEFVKISHSEIFLFDVFVPFDLVYDVLGCSEFFFLVMNRSFAELLRNMVFFDWTQQYNQVLKNAYWPNASNIFEYRFPVDFAFKRRIYCDFPSLFIVNQCQIVWAFQVFESFRQSDFMRIWDWVRRIKTELGFVVSSPSVN